MKDCCLHSTAREQNFWTSLDAPFRLPLLRLTQTYHRDERKKLAARRFKYSNGAHVNQKSFNIAADNYTKHLLI
jgi:hypothetical protein